MPLGAESPKSELGYDELLEAVASKIEAGETSSVDRLIEQNPSHAERVRKILPAMQAMFELGLESVAGKSESSAHSESGLAESIDGLLGDFRIIREIGRGGMGIVYEAEQLSLNRRVALKVLPLASTLDEKQLLRFRNESYAAASLSHPNIVDAYAVGVERGVHYFAMKYIDGHDLAAVVKEVRAGTDWERAVSTAEHALDTDSQDDPTTNFVHQESVDQAGVETHRSLAANAATDVASRSGRDDARRYIKNVVELFADIAKALDYAHQQGIVHRDIKPSNLMLDRSGKGWITDFGLAQMDQAGSMTMTGDIIGTIRYMSPEQAGGERQIIDHRSDVYSLGISLYEALALRPAFEGQDRVKLLREVRDEDPPPVGSLNSSIPKPIQTIVRKAISKQPADRYSTAQAFAEDLERFKAGEPIRATPPSVLQQTTSWARKRPKLVSSVAAALVVGVFSLSAASLLLWQEQENTKQALSDTEAARKDAESKAEESEAVLSFLVDDLLLSAKPSESLGRDMTVMELMDEAEKNIDTSFEDRPLVRASVHRALARTYHELGKWEMAEHHGRQAMQFRSANQGNGARDTISSMNLLAATLLQADKTDLARKQYEEARLLAANALGEEDYETLTARHGLARCDYVEGRYESARDGFEELIATKTKVNGASGQPFLWAVKGNYAALVSVLSEHKHAASVLEDLCEKTEEALGTEHPVALRNKSRLAACYSKLRNRPKAEELYTEVIGGRERVLGPKHYLTLSVRRDRAYLAVRFGDSSEAIPELQELLSICIKEFGERSSSTLLTRRCLAEAYNNVDEFAKAEAQLTQLLPLLSEQSGKTHANTLSGRSLMAMVLAGQARYDEAFAIIDDIVKIRSETLGPKAPSTLWSMHSKAVLAGNKGDLVNASKLHAEVLRARQEALGKYHVDSLVSLEFLAKNLKEQGKHAEAVSLFQSVLEEDSDQLPISMYENFSSEAGINLLSLRRPNEALPYLRQTLDSASKRLDECDNSLNNHRLNLGLALVESGEYQEGLALTRAVAELECGNPRGIAEVTRMAKYNLTTMLVQRCEKIAMLSILGKGTTEQLDTAIADGEEALSLINDEDASIGNDAQAVSIGSAPTPTTRIAWVKRRVAMAYLASNAFDKSVRLFEDANVIQGNTEMPFQMLLAIACWRAGDEAEARRLYDEAFAWQEAQENLQSIQIRFRHLAEEVMGIAQQDAP
ncbi:MAG: hypothetical protein Aurels2KO_50480 [Aureliella sp.]